LPAKQKQQQQQEIQATEAPVKHREGLIKALKIVIRLLNKLIWEEQQTPQMVFE
jgi:hypothetical protein